MIQWNALTGGGTPGRGRLPAFREVSVDGDHPRESAQ